MFLGESKSILFYAEEDGRITQDVRTYKAQDFSDEFFKIFESLSFFVFESIWFVIFSAGVPSRGEKIKVYAKSYLTLLTISKVSSKENYGLIIGIMQSVLSLGNVINIIKEVF